MCTSTPFLVEFAETAFIYRSATLFIRFVRLQYQIRPENTILLSFSRGSLSRPLETPNALHRLTPCGTAKPEAHPVAAIEPKRWRVSIY
jgi:hypothetical protein